MTEAYSIIGKPAPGGVLIAADHASNHVPDDIDLRIPHDFLNDHIAYDIGTQAIAEILVEKRDCLAILGGVSRLVVDYNRDPDDPAVIPQQSDAVEITGNAIDAAARAERISRFHAPYHAKLAELIDALQPALILSLHSFTPHLRSRVVDRPWEIGVLYNNYETASRLAINHLMECGLLVGDQLPYSGKEFNATMDRHAEPHGHPYLGIEIRQDQIAEPEGQARFANFLDQCLTSVLRGLA